MYSISFAQSQIQYNGYKDTLNEAGDHIWEYNSARRNYVNTELYGYDVTDLGDHGYI